MHKEGLKVFNWCTSNYISQTNQIKYYNLTDQSNYALYLALGLIGQFKTVVHQYINVMTVYIK